MFALKSLVTATVSKLMSPKQVAKIHSASPKLQFEQLEARDVPAVTIQFDYSYDTSGFFSGNNQGRRDVLQQAALDVAGELQTPLAQTAFSQISFSMGTSPPPSISNVTIPQDTLRVYVGAQDLSSRPNNPLAEAGPGGYSISNPQSTRGPVGLRSSNLSQLWGGSITFNTNLLNSTTLFTGVTAVGLQSNQYDLYSITVHELGHVLGYTSPLYSSAPRFNGTYAQTVYGGNVPVAPDAGHWAAGTKVSITSTRIPAMVPNATQGNRRIFSALDFAGLRDLGWKLDAWGRVPLNTGNASILISDNAGNSYGVFPNLGIWKKPAGTTGTAWIQVNTADSSLLVVDGQGNVYGSFPNQGIFEYPASATGTSWIQINTGTASMLAADGPGNLYGNFINQGIWKYATDSTGTVWTQVNIANTQLLTADGKGNLYGSFSNSNAAIQGIWKYNGANWVKLNDALPASLVADVLGNLYASFTGIGLGNGIWKNADGNTTLNAWTQVNKASTTTLTVDASGNLYGSFSDQGIWRLSTGSNSTSWDQISYLDGLTIAGGQNKEIFVTSIIGSPGIWRLTPRV